MEVFSPSAQDMLCAELSEATLRCVRDQHGNHVVQKCVEVVQPSERIREMIEVGVGVGWVGGCWWVGGGWEKDSSAVAPRIVKECLHVQSGALMLPPCPRLKLSRSSST